MVAPAIREIINRHPTAEFTLLTSPDGAALFRDFDSRIVRILKHGRKPLSKRLKWIYLYFVIKRLEFDSTYCLDGDWKIRKLLKYSAPNFLDIEPSASSKTFHGAIQALHRVGVNANSLSEIKVPFIPVSTDSVLAIKKILAENGIASSDFIVGLNPSFSGIKRKKTRQYKLWPTRYWAKLADDLYRYGQANNISIKTLIYSLPKDRFLAEEIVSYCEYPPTLLTPASDLGLFKAYLSLLDLYIGPDTGATHLAAALGTELISLFSVTDPFGCGPVVFDLKKSVIQAKDKGDHGSLLESISPEDVLKLAKYKIDKVASS